MRQGESSDSESQRKRALLPVKAVLFDFDGTLTLPGHLDFAEIRRAVGCPAGRSLLSHIESLADPEARRGAYRTLDEFETRAAERSREDPDAAGVMRFCKSHGLKLGIITRNSRRSVERSFLTFHGIRLDDFDVIISRDDPVEVKPAPDGVLRACERVGVRAAETVVVGDFIYDMQAGERAGAVTVFYDSDAERSFERPRCDHTIKRLGELPGLLSLYLPLPAGKVPNEMLGDFLTIGGDPLPENDRRANLEALLVGPGVGEDVAAIDLKRLQMEPTGTGPAPPPELDTAGAKVLLLKSDPITFVSEEFGHYLLTVNANDIATGGGTPRWLLATLLVPPGTLGAEIARLFADLRSECAAAGVVLAGGHTEITDAVVRPVVSGTMVGTVRTDRLVRKGTMRTGDSIVLTKGVAIEGTAILASKHRELLRARGVSPEAIRLGTGYAYRMSILPEARIAASNPGVTAMHDVTEGGIATALRELSTAGGHRLHIDLDRIVVLPETELFCRVLGLDPLGLIGSGSLIITVAPQYEEALQAELNEAGISTEQIGAVLEPGEGIEAGSSGHPAEMPLFDSDEITHLP